MNEKNLLRVKRYKRAFCDDDGVNELSDVEILKRIELEKFFYRAENKYIEKQIEKLNSL